MCVWVVRTASSFRSRFHTSPSSIIFLRFFCSAFSGFLNLQTERSGNIPTPKKFSTIRFGPVWCHTLIKGKLCTPQKTDLVVIIFDHTCFTSNIRGGGATFVFSERTQNQRSIEGNVSSEVRYGPTGPSKI